MFEKRKSILLGGVRQVINYYLILTFQTQLFWKFHFKAVQSLKISHIYALKYWYTTIYPELNLWIQ